jgi:hypothetical protein
LLEAGERLTMAANHRGVGMRCLLAALAAFGTACTASAHDLVLSVPEDLFVVEGSRITLSATIKNNGSEAFVFSAVQSPLALLTGDGAKVQGGYASDNGGPLSLTRAVANDFRFGPDDGDPTAFYGQFSGVTIAPGDSFTFVFGRSTIPALPIGTSGTNEFGLYFRTSKPGWAITGAKISYRATLGESAESVGLRTVAFQNSIPEPTVWALLILGFGSTGAAARRKMRSGCVLAAG